MPLTADLSRIYAINATAPSNVSALRKSFTHEGSEAATLVSYRKGGLFAAHSTEGLSLYVGRLGEFIVCNQVADNRQIFYKVEKPRHSILRFDKFCRTLRQVVTEVLVFMAKAPGVIGYIFCTKLTTRSVYRRII